MYKLIYFSRIYYIHVFFFTDTATTEIYTYLHTLSLHDALPFWHMETHTFASCVLLVASCSLPFWSPTWPDLACLRRPPAPWLGIWSWAKPAKWATARAATLSVETIQSQPATRPA